MAYNRLNRLKYYKNVLEIVEKHYFPGVTTYAGIWRKYVDPIYPMSYDKFMDIVNYPNLNDEIAKEMKKSGKQETEFPT